MITQEEFDTYLAEIRNAKGQIPTTWGTIQRDDYDKKIDSEIDYFSIREFNTLVTRLDAFLSVHPEFDPEKLKQYYYHRWGAYMTSITDEYIFYSKQNVAGNPEIGKEWDIRFYNRLFQQFDLKSTVLPKKYRADAEKYINKPEVIGYDLYVHQSKSVRYSENNRLFLIHHSFITPYDELDLRLNVKFKDEVITEYIKRLKKPSYKFFELSAYMNSDPIFDIIYLIENLDGSLEYKIASQKLN